MRAYNKLLRPKVHAFIHSALGKSRREEKATKKQTHTKYEIDANLEDSVIPPSNAISTSIYVFPTVIRMLL